MREPARVLNHEIEDVAVDHQIAPSVRAFVDRRLDHFDTAEMRAVIGAQEFVVIARHIDDARALAHLAQHLLNEIIVRLWPVPVRFQRPAIDDITDEIDSFGIMDAEEIEQPIGLRSSRAQMHVGNKQGAKVPFHLSFTHRVASHVRAVTRFS